MGAYLRPSTLDAALAALAEGAWTPLAGGTDLYPEQATRDAWGRRLQPDLLDLSALNELAGLEERENHWRIGAGVTWSQIAQAPLAPCFDGLKAAAREVGGLQIQNRGTLAGNLCNASPAADGGPPLLALDAAVELAGAEGLRRLPLADFLLGNRRTARRPGELLTAILVPKPAGEGRSRFLKLGARRYLVISIVMVAANLTLDAEGRIAAAGLAVGACAPVPQRLPELEARLLGRPLAPGLGGLLRESDLAPLVPIGDIRAEADYRRAAAAELLRRCLDELAREAA